LNSTALPFAVAWVKKSYSLSEVTLTSASGASSSRVNSPFFFDSSPCVANAENMSSKVQAWRTPVIVPSGANTSSLFIVTQTCGCADAAVVAVASAASAAAMERTKRLTMSLARRALAARYHGLRQNGGRIAGAGRRDRKMTRKLHARRAAVGARIVGAFEGSIRVQHH